MEPQSQHDEDRDTARPDPVGQAPQPERRRPHWTWHGAWLVVRLGGSLVAGVAVAIVALGWRLERGPLSLDFLTPWVQEALSAPGRNISVVIEHTELTLDPTAHTFDFLADGVHLRRTDGSAEVVLPRIALNFSLRAALSGVLAPTRIVLIAPELRLERAPDGTIHVGLGAGSGSEGFASDILSDLEARPNQRGPLGYLQEVAVRDAVFTLDDRALGVTWQAKRADATLFRSQAGISGDAQVTIAAGGQEAEMHCDFRYLDAEHRLAGELDVADLEPARFAAAAAPLALLDRLKLPITGRIRFSLDVKTLHVEGSRGDFTIGRGRIDDPHLEGGTLAIAGGVLSLAYDPQAARLSLENLTLDLGGPEIALTAEINGVDREFLRGGALKRLDIDGGLTLRRLPLDDLDRLWPQWLSPSSRSWVTEHIHDGVADETAAKLHLVVDLAPDAPKPVVVDALSGTIAYHDLTVDYFPPLTPVHHVDGTGSFDRSRFEFRPSGGALAGLRITGGTIELTKLDTNDETIAINLDVSGPLRDTLTIIDSKPLGYAHSFGVDPAKTEGTTDQKLFFRFPLIHDLKIDDVEFGAKATIKDAAIAGIAFGHDLTKGDLTLELTRASLKLQGTAEIDAVPAALSWTQSLKGDGARRYTLKARLDDADRKRLKVDFVPEMLAGPVGVDLVYTGQKSSAEASLALDLTDATLRVDRLNLMKPAGVATTAQLKLVFAGDRLTGIPDATIKGDQIDAALAVAFVPETGELRRIDVRRLIAGGTNVTGWVQRQANGGWSATITGKSLDASRLVSNLGRGASDERETPLSVTAKIDRVILGPDREIAGLVLRFLSDEQHWRTVLVDGNLSGGGTVAVRFGEPPNPLDLRIVTDNMGATLKLLDVSDNVVGGAVTVKGKAEDRDGLRVFSGHVEGVNYKIAKAPLFARILSIASFSAINSMLSGEGIPFTRVIGDFTYEDGKLTLKNARAYGGAIGVNVEGSLSLRDDAIDLSGTLVPAYTINTLLGKVPVLGPLLLGGEGQGVFGANFRVTGALSEPQVTVNALSALAPGFLRKLFLFDAPASNAPGTDIAPIPPVESGSH